MFRLRPKLEVKLNGAISDVQFKPSPKTADSIKAASFASLDLFPNGHIGVDQKRVRKSVFFIG
ncbi:hypothetical protein, partial [Treponema socranskii]|uniref:hypothetical protein n=1 Tax=Treponema socranskii TaxID=53419 RepID=UPI0028EFE054